MDFFKKFSNKPSPKQVARDRLKLILINDRGCLPEETLESIKLEFLKIISKYIDIDISEIDITISKQEGPDGNNSSLVANVPIRSIK